MMQHLTPALMDRNRGICEIGTDQGFESTILTKLVEAVLAAMALAADGLNCS